MYKQKSHNRFELALKFIQASKEAKIIAREENPEGIRDFLKKIGSNFQIAEQTLNFDFKNAWKILDNFNLSARSAEAANLKNFDFEFLRKGWDSNPRYRCRYNSFRDCPIRPL